MLESSYTSMKVEQRMEDSDPLRHLNGAPHEDSSTQLKIENLISKFGENTLFFIFYFQQNTHKQLLAAEELARRKW